MVLVLVVDGFVEGIIFATTTGFELEGGKGGGATDGCRGIAIVAGVVAVAELFCFCFVAFMRPREATTGLLLLPLLLLSAFRLLPPLLLMLLLLLLSGTNGLFGFLSTVTLSFPSSFFPFRSEIGVGDFEDAAVAVTFGLLSFSPFNVCVCLCVCA